MSSMEHNDEVLAKDPAELKVLLDTNIYQWMQEIALATQIHPLDLLDQMDNVSYYFATSVINEVAKSPQGYSANTFRMFQHSLRDEMTVDLDAETDARMLYNAKDGTTKFATLNKISQVDHSQILLCHNHRKEHLVLVTNDHNMIKNANAVLDRHMMDFKYFLKYIDEATPEGELKNEWTKVRKYYDENGGNKRPKTVRRISDRQPGV